MFQNLMTRASFVVKQNGMMETLTLQLGALMKEQQTRAEEARKLQQMLGAVLERLERLEEQK